MADYIPELKGLIKTDRIEQAKTLLGDFNRRSGEDRRTVIEMLALASDGTGLELIEFLMAGAPDKSMQEKLFQLATDRAHLNYAFAELLLAHGTPDQIRHTVPLLKHILSKATRGDLLNRILRTVGKLRLEALTDDVAEFIFYDDDDLKRESVKALERMGTASALGHLEHIAGTDKSDMDILDAIDMLREKLGTGSADEQEENPRLSPQKGAAPEPQDEAEGKSGPEDAEVQLKNLTSSRLNLRVKAYGQLCTTPDLVADALHQNLETQNHDLLINLLRLTTRTIPKKAVGDLLSLVTRKNLEASHKIATLTALAAYPELESAAAVLKLAEASSMVVRLAAVKVLDRHCSDYIAAEVKKRIETGTKKGEALGVTILDAGASRLMDALMDSDTFSYIASNYLEHSAPVSAIDAYIRVLEKRNRTSTVKKYSRIRLEQAGKNRPFFVVIHPTQAYLDVYTKLIHNCGFDTRCFCAPQEAFESVVFEKPAAVISDLFIGQISILELAGEIRELYSKDQVPIIISTLQRDLDKKIAEKEFQHAGINALCAYPAKASQIKSWGAAK